MDQREAWIPPPAARFSPNMRGDWARVGPHRIGVQLALAALLAGPPGAQAGAWTQDAGSWFLKLGYDRLFTGRRFDVTGDRVAFRETLPGFDDEDEYRGQALRVYAEHGLTDEWTVVASGSLEWIEMKANHVTERTTGLSDLRLQIKRRLVAAPFVVSILGEGKIPTGYEVARSPALGTGETDFGGRLAVGGARGPLYVTGEAGFLARGGSLSDQTPFALEAGYSWTRSIFAKAVVHGALTAPRPRGTSGNFDPALADSRYVSASFAVGLRGDVLDVVVGADHMLTGRNVLAGTRFEFSIWYEY